MQTHDEVGSFEVRIKQRDTLLVYEYAAHPFDVVGWDGYHHTNAGTDGVIYYASGEFMSRRGIECGSITLHPDGIPHGPHPGTVEASIGKEATVELAVMVDTLHPLTVGRGAEEIEDPDYLTSWLDTDPSTE